MLLYGMREIFGQVTFTVAILIIAIAEICIALSANMRVHRALVMTFHLLPAFIAEEISVFTVTVGYLLIASIADMHTYGFVSAVDDSVTSVAIVIFIIVYVIANKFFATFITVSVVIIIVAIGGKPYFAPIACMVIIVVLMPDVIEVLFTRSFLTASVAERISVIVDMMNAF